MEYGRSNQGPVLDEDDDDVDVPLPSHRCPSPVPYCHRSYK
jgi:hypothetical protein